MTTLTVYDPPLCCSTGVCGADVDQRLVNFAADVDWLKSRGAEVRRINLSQEPMEFVSNPAIKALMDDAGSDGLPAIVVAGDVVSTARYPARGELAEWAGLSGAPGNEVPVLGQEGCCGGSTSAAASDSGCGCGGSAKDAPDDARTATGCC